MSVYMVFQPMRLAIVCVTATRRGLLPRVFTLTSHLTIKGGLFSVALAVTRTINFYLLIVNYPSAFPLGSMVARAARTFLSATGAER